MLKLKLKGFTLIECLVSLALLGVASLSMVQIYANVCMVNRSNHEVNTSLMYQMQYVENYSGTNATGDSDKIVIYANGTGTDLSGEYAKPSDTSDIKHVKITRTDTSEEYFFPADVHILLTRDYSSTEDNGEVATDGNSDTGRYELRYKYVVGNNNGED